MQVISLINFVIFWKLAGGSSSRDPVKLSAARCRKSAHLFYANRKSAAGSVHKMDFVCPRQISLSGVLWKEQMREQKLFERGKLSNSPHKILLIQPFFVTVQEQFLQISLAASSGRKSRGLTWSRGDFLLVYLLLPLLRCFNCCFSSLSHHLSDVRVSSRGRVEKTKACSFFCNRLVCSLLSFSRFMKFLCRWKLSGSGGIKNERREN